MGKEEISPYAREGKREEKIRREKREETISSSFKTREKPVWKRK